MSALQRMTPEQLGRQVTLALQTKDKEHLAAVVAEAARRVGLPLTKQSGSEKK